MENKHILNAVQILEEAKNYAVKELETEAILSLRVGNTMQTLINGLKHVGGFVGQTAAASDDSGIKPAKTFMGLNLEELDEQKKPAKVDVPMDEKELFRQEVISLHSGFLDRDENDLKESLTREQLLGVAKLAGITVEDPAKQNVTLKLIREVKAAMEENIRLQEERDAKIQELDEQKKEGAPEEKEGE